MRFDSDYHRDGRRRGRGRLFLLLLLLGGLVFAGAGAFRIGPAPAVTLTPQPKLVGRQAPVAIRVSEPKRGLTRIRVELVQQGTAKSLLDQSFAPTPGWKLWGDAVGEHALSVDLGKGAHPELREGEATLRVVADRAPSWLRRGEPTVVEHGYVLRLTPPSLEVLSSQHYVAQGGAEAVVYRVGETSAKDGVEVGARFFPGYPLPGGGARDRFALFAVPYDESDASRVRVVATDEAGNQRTATFVDQFFPQPPKGDVIELDAKFLGKVVPEILAETPDLTDKGDLLQNYLQINRDLRRANNEELVRLAAKTKQEFLWKVPFFALPGGQVMSSFADRRTYVYGGREVDRQDHLGFDLASTSKAEVPASNRGVVVLARFFGIFGNAVVIDHGYGLSTLYAHLSSFAVKEGEVVERGQIVGRSGATGLAAGDHLHFSFLLQGLPVRPIEWWDAHWLTDRLKRKLGPALPFAG
jgi:murein DD-endopeptidase MepM/ murein hydrolase activator NlpD